MILKSDLIFQFIHKGIPLGSVRINPEKMKKSLGKWKVDDVFFIKKKYEVQGSVYIQAMLTTDGNISEKEP